MATSFVESGSLGTGADQSSYASGTVVAAENDWVILGCAIAGSATVATIDSAAGSALGAMTLVKMTLSPANNHRLAVFKKKVGAGGISEVLTATLSGTAARGVVMVMVVSSGNATDIIQGTNFDDDGSSSATALQCVLAAFAAGGTTLAFASYLNNGDLINTTGHTIGTNVTCGEALRGSASWQLSEDATVDITKTGGAVNFIGIAMEIATAAAGGASKGKAMHHYTKNLG